MKDIKNAFKLLENLMESNPNFKKLVNDGIISGKVRLFNEEEFSKIKEQNYIAPRKELEEEIPSFYDLFLLGYNIGNCIQTSRQLSYSYRNVDIVSGVLPLLKGSLHAEKEGGHGWLEVDGKIIDTSLMLIIDKSLEKDFGYIEERRLRYVDLISDDMYLARRQFVLDKNIKSKKSSK